MNIKRIMKKVAFIFLCLAMMFGVFDSIPLIGNNLSKVENVYATSRSASEAISWVQSKLGQSIDYDGVYGAQCVDLIKAYYNYLGVTPVSGNGCDYISNSVPSGWNRIQGATPQKGDILVYSSSTSNPYGHVAIYESDYATYHQNFSSHAYVEKITAIKYNGFTNGYWGVIRPNWSSSSTTSSTANVSFTEQKINSTDPTNAEVYTKVLNPNYLTVQSVGCRLYNSSGSFLYSYSESCGLKTSYVNYTCNFNTDMKYTLIGGVTYKYQLYAIVNGVEYKDSMQSFTTTGTHTHNYVTTTTKATTSRNGSIVKKCSLCGLTVSSTISYPKTVTLSKVNFIYSGKVQKPTVTVKAANGNKIATSNYKVSYSAASKNVGTYTVTITFKGNYSGTIKKTYKIVPKATSVSSLKAVSKGFTVKWKKQSTQVTGYQIQYSTNSSFSKAKTVTVTKNSTISKSITKLIAKKKYYVRVRTYKTVNGTKFYSSWSSAKSITTKK
jgi:hypothetical protein